MRARGVRQTGDQKGRPVDSSRGWLLLLAALCAVCLTGFGPPRLVDREVAATQRLSVGELRAWAEAAEPPAVTTKSFLLYDVDADQVLYAADADAALPAASLTKLMTALLVLENGRLESQVTIVPEDVTDGTTMGLVVGETLTEEELLWGLLVASGNDAALALARHVAGSVGEFVARMNARASELGMHRSHYVNPHGFDAEGHVTSARDLMTLTRQLLAYPLFRQIVGTETAEVAGRELTNTNELLAAWPDADGIKTGTTPEAGECLVASFTADGHQVVVIVLGSQSRYADARSLYDLYRANYAWVQGNAAELAVMDRVYDGEGEVWYLSAGGEAPETLQPRWAAPPLRSVRVIDGADARTYHSGAVVGDLEWRVGDRLVGTQPLTVR